MSEPIESIQVIDLGVVDASSERACQQQAALDSAHRELIAEKRRERARRPMDIGWVRYSVCFETDLFPSALQRSDIAFEIVELISGDTCDLSIHEFVDE